MNDAKAPVAVGLGELLWDCFADDRRPGGAPANVAFHARQLGLGGVICSSVGRDELGDAMLQFIESNGLSTEYIQRDPQHGTGRVDITSDERGEPNYKFADDVAWDHLALDAEWRRLAPTVAAVCFGTLAQRGEVSRATIHDFLDAAPGDALKVYDVNLRPPWYERAWIEPSLRAADVVKLNHEEVGVLAELLELADEPGEFARTVQQDFDVEVVCVTRGENGCLLASGDEVVERPGVEVHEVHPVGAGDSFTAALIYARLHDWPLDRTAAFANQVAALVAGKAGAMPSLREEFAELMRQQAP